MDAHNLIQWWITTASNDAEGMGAKMNEYGAGDLVEIGKAIQASSPDLSGIDPFEIGVYFYVIGKIARVTSAHRRGKPASTDTWHDLSIYAKMVEARRASVWPKDEH